MVFLSCLIGTWTDYAISYQQNFRIGCHANIYTPSSPMLKHGLYKHIILFFCLKKNVLIVYMCVCAYVASCAILVSYNHANKCKAIFFRSFAREFLCRSSILFILGGFSKRRRCKKNYSFVSRSI